MPAIIFPLIRNRLTGQGGTFRLLMGRYFPWTDQLVAPIRTPGIPTPIIFWGALSQRFNKRFDLAFPASQHPTVLTISGVTRDASGNPLGGCVVKLFRTADDLLITQTI